MSITAGAISLVSVTSTAASLSATAASGGTAPYTYQWYKSTVSGFSPGAGNMIAGATALTLADSGLIPGTMYFYKVVATDAAAASVTYSQQLVTTMAPVLSQNQFAQAPYLGMIDMRFDYDTVSCLVDVSQAGAMSAGAAVKIVDSSDGVPKVVGCAADSDDVFGFINYDVKSQAFVAGVPCEVSQAGNVMYLYATAAVARGARVQLDLSTMGGVAPMSVSSGADIVGYAFDKASAPGQLIRVKLFNPSFTKA